MNKFFPAINLVFVLIITLLATLSVRIWTHPTYPSRIDGASIIKSPKSLKKSIVSRSGYNSEIVAQVAQENIFLKQRREYVPPPTQIPAPAPAPKTIVPSPNLVLKGVLMLGGTKIAILEGKYWAIQGNRPVEKKVKKKGYSLGQIVGDFELTEIDKTSVTLDDNNGRVVRVRLTKRSPDKIIHRKGTAFYQKNRKYDPSKFKPTPIKNRPIPSTKTTPNSKPTPAPVFRISGSRTPVPRPTHISGR